MNPDAPISDREPIRLFVLAMSFIAGLGVFFGAWGGGVDWRVAIGMGLGAFAAPAGGAEAARAKAYAPSTVHSVMDAESVIAQTQAG